MASIALRGVAKTYPNGYRAVRSLDLEIADGEFVVLVGPSGCGKSTTLRMVAGLESPTAGSILIGGRDVTQLPPQERDIAMVFQTYALYPHKTVRENLEFPLRMRRASREVVAERVEEAARVLGLEALLDATPRQLSGGQRQRVALGRALVREPQAFLFDEPLSNLDAKLRVQTRAELARLHRRLGATMLYVTHDQEEAMTLGDRVAVMHEGVLQQVAPPLEVYGRPANRFVAAFVGSPAMNFFPARLRRDRGIAVALGEVVLPLSVPVSPDDLPADVLLGIRPHDVEVVEPGAGDVDARVDVIEPLGSSLLVHVVLDDAEDAARVVTPPDRDLAEGRSVGLAFRRDRLHLFGGEGERRLN